MSLTLQNLGASYGTKTVLSGVNLDIAPGQCLALLGPNGAGKSTLLKTLTAAIAVQGQIKWGEQDLMQMRPEHRARTLAYLAQSRIGPPHAAVRDVIALGRIPYGHHWRGLSTADDAAIARVIQRLDLGPLAHRKFGTLSGGEAARVLLARALCVEAPILLVDEPIAGLDPYYQLAILETLQAEAAQGRIVIIALHDLNLAARYCSHYAVLQEGRLVDHGTMDDGLSYDVLKTVFRIEMKGTIARPVH